MEARQFDEFARRIRALTVPRIPRRGVFSLLGGGAFAGVLGKELAHPNLAEAKKCQKEGQKCDKKKCNKKNKKCCCNDLKCKNDRCEGKGSACSTNANFDFSLVSFDGSDSFSRPWGIATDPDGNFYVTDNNNERVVAFNQNGVFQDEFGDSGQGSNDFVDPHGIGFNVRSNGNFRLYVTDDAQNNNDDRIRNFDGDLDEPADFGDVDQRLGNDPGEGNIFPYGVAVDPNNRVWIVNQTTPGQVFLFDRNGGFIATFTPDFPETDADDDQLREPEGIAVYKDSNNNNTFVYVADTDNNRVVKFRYDSNDEEDGLTYITEVGRTDGNSGTGNREFNQPIGLAADRCGNVWVADSFNDRVAVFDKGLEFIDNFDQNFDTPTGVALGPDQDVLYVADSDNNRIVKFDLT